MKGEIREPGETLSDLALKFDGIKMWCLVLLMCSIVKLDSSPVGDRDSMCSYLGPENLRNLDCAQYTKVDGKRTERNVDSFVAGPVGDIMNLVTSNFNENSDGKRGEVCKACKTAVTLAKFFASSKKSEKELITLASSFCADLNILTKPMCDGLMNINGPALIQIIKTSPLTATQLCSFLVKSDCDEENIPEHNWQIVMPQRVENRIKPRKLESSDLSKPLKILHLSDTHYDPRYVEGVAAECALPLCCREESGSAEGNSSLSGKWGGWKCDIPERTLDNLLEHIAEQHKDVDYVLWTGDIPPHDSWSMLRNESLYVLSNTVSKVLKTFPNTPVYPALGNHEAVPPNLFPPPGITARWSVDWLYEELEKQWAPWVSPDSSETVRKGGFYTLLARPGLRIISLNTNYCYFANWWLILNSTDPAQELEWLINVLHSAEEKGEKVHIIGHIPPGHTDCLKTWQTNYYSIIERFNETITAQFFGHTHADEFELFYDRANSNHAINVAYIAPSVTTYTNLNPAYRIYYIDGDYDGSSRAVLDHETWFMDLQEANDNDAPEWKILYKAKDTFNMTSLTPNDWHELYLKMSEDNELFEVYDRVFWSNSTKRLPCNKKCKVTRLCGIRSCVQYGNVNATAEALIEK